MELAITTLSFDNHLPDNGQCRSRHVGVSYINKLSSLYCCAIDGTKAVNHITARNMDNGMLRCFMNISEAV